MEIVASFDYSIAAEGINLLAVFSAAVASFVLGGFWYHEKAFGARWQKLVKLSKKDIQDANMTQVFGAAFALTFVQGLFLAMIMSGLAIVEFGEGALFGMFVGAAFGVATVGVQYSYAQRPLSQFAIDGGYIVANYTIMGMIIGLW